MFLWGFVLNLYGPDQGRSFSDLVYQWKLTCSENTGRLNLDRYEVGVLPIGNLFVYKL